MQIFISIPKNGKQPFARVTITNEFTGETKQFIGTLRSSEKEDGIFYFNDHLRLDSEPKSGRKEG